MRLRGNKLVLLVRNGFKMCITATSFAFLMGERLMRWRLAMLDLNRINDVDQCVLFNKPFVHSKQPWDSLITIYATNSRWRRFRSRTKPTRSDLYLS